MKIVYVSDEDLKKLVIKASLVDQMSLEDMSHLIRWCDKQSSDLWKDMSFQEILNVYRASAGWLTWEGWFEEDSLAATHAWNDAVIDGGNKLYDSRLPNNGY